MIILVIICALFHFCPVLHYYKGVSQQQQKFGKLDRFICFILRPFHKSTAYRTIELDFFYHLSNANDRFSLMCAAKRVNYSSTSGVRLIIHIQSVKWFWLVLFIEQLLISNQQICRIDYEEWPFFRHTLRPCETIFLCWFHFASARSLTIISAMKK